MSGSAQGARNFDTLNALRGVAAVLILAWHFPGIAWQEKIWAGYLSVDLFFLLSGVVIAHAYEAKLRAGWHPLRFLIARVVRLWPLYLLGTGIGVAAATVAFLYDGLPLWMFKAPLRDAVLALFLLPKMTNTPVVFPFNPPAWSLCCEFVVNVAYAAIGYRMSNRTIGATVGIALIAMLAGATFWVDLGGGLNLGAAPDRFLIGLARAFFGFPLGVLIYRLWQGDRLPVIKLPPLALVGIFVATLFVLPAGPTAHLVAACVATVVVWPAVVVAAMQVEPRGWQLRVAARLALLSYPLYAIHDAVYLATGLFVIRVPVSPMVVHLAGAVVSVLIASAAIRYFDSPVRRRLTHWARMPKTAPVAAPPL